MDDLDKQYRAWDDLIARLPPKEAAEEQLLQQQFYADKGKPPEIKQLVDDTLDDAEAVLQELGFGEISSGGSASANDSASMTSDAKSIKPDQCALELLLLNTTIGNMPKFDGQKQKWTTFYTNFIAVIDKAHITNVHKFQLLRQLLDFEKTSRTIRKYSTTGNRTQQKVQIVATCSTI
uniref:Uncharacterized protein n=1 Tax=Panagrolaimus sp. JU765 TaxID=591449 RepID=A0AC34RD20_9BILA